MRVLDAYLETHRRLGLLRFGIMLRSLLVLSLISLENWRPPIAPSISLGTGYPSWFVFLSDVLACSIVALFLCYLSMFIRFFASKNAIAFHNSPRRRYVVPEAEALKRAQDFRPSAGPNRNSKWADSICLTCGKNSVRKNNQNNQLVI